MGDQHSLANKVAFAFVAASAGIQAAQQALKEAPDLVARSPVPEMNSGAWNYLPIALVSVAVLLWLAQLAYDRGFKPVALLPYSNIASKDATQPPASPRSTEREYLPASFKRSLMSLLRRRHTDAELQAMLRPHQGRWLRMTVYLRNAIPSRDYIHVIAQPSPETASGSISMYFTLRNEPFFAAMKMSEKFDCDLQTVQDGHAIRLENGEIV